MAEPIPDALRRFVTTRAQGCCEYCRSQEAYATERFSIEHIHPRAAGGMTVPDNLALACQGCNGHKAVTHTAPDPQTGELVALFHPRQHNWSQHFTWSEDKLQVLALTSTGRATVVRLRLNRPSLINLRRALLAIGVHPPAETDINTDD